MLELHNPPEATVPPDAIAVAIDGRLVRIWVTPERGLRIEIDRTRSAGPLILDRFQAAALRMALARSALPPREPLNWDNIDGEKWREAAPEERDRMRAEALEYRRPPVGD